MRVRVASLSQTVVLRAGVEGLRLVDGEGRWVCAGGVVRVDGWGEGVGGEFVTGWDG